MTPQTEAGRALVDMKRYPMTPAQFYDLVVAIEAESLPTVDELAQALTECAPARPGIHAEAEAILHELRKNRAALSSEPVR